MKINVKTSNPENFTKASRPLSSIRYIVIHYTGGSADTAKNNADYFARENVGVSAHYFVDESTVWQSVPDNHNAWHCGTKNKYYHPSCRNSNSIGIELCARKTMSGEYYFPYETVALAVELTKALIAKYNIPIENVVRHYDVTHKQCPLPYLSGNGWAELKKKLTDCTEEDEMTIYKTLNDVPAWGQQCVQHLIAKGYLNGGSNDNLDLEHYMLRTLVIGYRAGLYR